MSTVTTKGITYVGSYWDAKEFQLVDSDGFVVAHLNMSQFHDAIEAYEDMFSKVIYK
jgi:hypothetical protein